MIEFRINIKDLTKFAKQTKEFQKNIEQGLMQRLLPDIVRETTNEIYSRVPIDTTALMQSITVKTMGKNRMVISSDSPHAIFQELGFTPHYVRRADWQGKEPPDAAAAFVSRFTPFMEPSVIAVAHKLPEMAKNMVIDAERRSFV